MALHFPDYELEWIMRTDASQVACAAVLFMVVVDEDNKKTYKLIGCASKKFSAQATSWDIHKKEAYAMFFGFFTFAYYLSSKEFTVQVDHANLTYLGDNQTPIVVRWRIFMQSFEFKIQRIPGTRMGLADYMSRMYPDVNSDDDKVQCIKEDDELLVIGMALDLLLLEEPSDPNKQSIYSALDARPTLNKKQITDEPVDYTKHDINYYIGKCHGGRKFHPGVWRTWISLNKRFPGHRITIHQVDDYVKSCVICQKNTNNMTDYVEPVRKHLKVNHPRKRIGLDTLTVTPPDDDGHMCMDVIVDLFLQVVL